MPLPLFLLLYYFIHIYRFIVITHIFVIFLSVMLLIRSCFQSKMSWNLNAPAFVPNVNAPAFVPGQTWGATPPSQPAVESELLLFQLLLIFVSDWDDESVAPPSEPATAEVPVAERPPAPPAQKESTPAENKPHVEEKDDIITPLAKKFERIAYVDGKF